MARLAVPQLRGIALQTTSTATQRVSLRALMPMVAKDAKTAWIHAAKPGEYKGHPSGPFTFDSKVFASIVKNFEAQANPLPLTYDHPYYDGTGPVVKAGWIQKLKYDSRGLWAYCEFTDKAVELNRQGSYRFCSVVVSLESTDRVTGEPTGPELFEIGLTDSPYIDGLEPIRLSRLASARKLSMSDIELIKQALKDLPEDASAAQVMEYVEALRKVDQAKNGEMPGEEAPADEAAPMSADASDAVALADAPAAEVSLEGDMPMEGEADAGAKEQLAKLIEEASGMDLASAIAALEANKDALAAIFGAAPADGTAADGEAAPAAGAFSRELGLLRGTIKQLSAKVNELEKEKAEARAAEAAVKAEAVRADVTARVGKLVEAGRILDKDAAGWVKLGIEAPAHFDNLVESLKPVVITETLTAPAAPAAAPEADNEELDELIEAFKFAKVRNPREAALKVLASRKA